MNNGHEHSCSTAVPLIKCGSRHWVLEVVNKLNESYFTQDDVRLLEVWRVQQPFQL